MESARAVEVRGEQLSSRRGGRRREDEHHADPCRHRGPHPARSGQQRHESLRARRASLRRSLLAHLSRRLRQRVRHLGVELRARVAVSPRPARPRRGCARRYGRSDRIAWKASAQKPMRLASGISSPASPSGYPRPSQRSWLWRTSGAMPASSGTDWTISAPVTVCWRISAHSSSSRGPRLQRAPPGEADLPDVVELGGGEQLEAVVPVDPEHVGDGVTQMHHVVGMRRRWRRRTRGSRRPPCSRPRAWPPTPSRPRACRVDTRPMGRTRPCSSG